MTEVRPAARGGQAEPRLGWLAERASAPVDIAWLAAFRVLFGATMAVSMLRFLAYGWIDGLFVDPRFHFKYWPFDFVDALPGPYMHGLFWLLFAAAVCIAAGLFFRAAAWAFAVGFVYLQLIDVTTYLNHYYLAVLLSVLLAISPAHHAASLDAARSPGLRSASVPMVWLWLLRFQVGTVYTFAGLAKLHGDWLLHGQPLSIWLTSRTDVPVIGGLFTLPHAPLIMSWAGFLFDTLAPWFLLARRTRPFAYGAVLLFHGLTRLLFPIGMFPVIMVLGALVFFSPRWPRRILRGALLAQGPSAPATPWAARPPFLACAAAYAALQLLVPLRFFAYGGNVRWHEQGMRFSWRVMVREKNGSVVFHVRDPRTGHVWQVSPHRYLTRLQEREMSGQPDLILQFAHFLARDFAARGVSGVEVRAEARVSLNGRRAALLIDPSIDLVGVRDGLLPASWILPAPEGPPPHTRPI